MKQLVCEMCGSNDLIKDGGVFVCQSCGCKYSVEEAKRMMIEGTVDVQGTVKVDNSEFVQKYLANARRAKEKEDWEETEKYYNLVEQNDPTNIEAIFYSSYGKAKSTLVDADLYKRQAAFKVLRNCVSIIDDNYRVEDGEINKAAIEQISSDILLMACSSYVYTEKKNGYGIVVSSNKKETVTLFNELGLEFIQTCSNIAQKYPDDQVLEKIYFYKLAKKHAKFILENGSLSFSDSSDIKKLIETCNKQIIDIAAKFEKEARDTYWMQHADEKAALESEKENLYKVLLELAAEAKNLPGMTEKSRLEKRIEELKEEKSALSIFAGKQRKAVQAQIDGLHIKLEEVEDSMEEPLADIARRADAVRARISEIDSTFNMSRL